MNNSLRLFLVLLSLSLLPIWAQDDSSPARDLLNSAFAQLKSGGWGSDDFGNMLKKILTEYSESPEAKTASTLFVPYLMLKGNYDDAMTLSNSVIQSQPNTWQSSFAMLNRISILQAQGKSVDALQSAIQAIPAIESANLKDVKDPDFTNFLRSAGLRKSGIQDGALGLAATQLIQNGSAQEALPFIDRIRDPKIRSLITKDLPPGLSDAASAADAAAATTPGSESAPKPDATPFGVPK